MPSANRRDCLVDRREFVGAIGASGIAGLAGCVNSLPGFGGGGDDGIEYWTLFGGGDGDAMEAMVDQYNEEHDVQVNRQRQPWDEYYDKLYTALTGGSAPDLAVIHTSQLAAYSDYLQPLGDLIDDSTTDDYVDSIWTKTEMDGDRLALPLDTHPAGFYYNKDIFEEAGLDPESPPTTPEEFSEACDAIAENTEYHAFGPTPYGGFELIRTYFMFLRQTGGQLLNDDRTQAAFDTEAGVEVAEYLANISGDWGWDSPEIADNRWEKEFRSGQLGILQNGTWFYGVAADADFDFGMFEPFVYPGGDEEFTWADSHTLAVPRDPDRSEEVTQQAVEAAVWLTQETDTWGTDAGHLPASESILESDELRDTDVWDKTLSTYYDMAQNDQLAYQPRIEAMSEYQDPLWENLAEIYSQNLSPEDGISNAAEEINSTLE